MIKICKLLSSDNATQVATLLSQLIVTLQEKTSSVEKKESVEMEAQTEEGDWRNTEKLEVLFQENLHLGNIIKVLEDDIARYRHENLKLEKALKKAQENLAMHGKNQNNTSSWFSLPSEFKTSWDDLIKDKLPSTFTDFLENPIIYLNIIQDFALIINENTKALIREKNKEICSLLKVSDASEQLIYKQMINIYQDFNSSIFSLEEGQIRKIKLEAKHAFLDIISHKFCSELMTDDYHGDGAPDRSAEKNEKFLVSSDFKLYVEQLLESDDFLKFIRTFYSLCLFMNLNDPPLKLPIEPFAQRRYIYRYFHKNDLYCIDGFAKENAPSLVILPPVMRNNFPYKGIKPAVLIIEKDTVTNRIKEKMEEVEAEEKAKNEKRLEKDSHLQEEDLTIGHERDPLNCTSNNNSCILNESVMRKTLFQTARKAVGTCDKEVSTRENEAYCKEIAIQTDKEPTDNGELEWFSSFCPLRGPQNVNERSQGKESDLNSDCEEMESVKGNVRESPLSFHRDEARASELEIGVVQGNIYSLRTGTGTGNKKKQDEISEILALNDDYSLDFGRKSEFYGLNKENSVFKEKGDNSKLSSNRPLEEPEIKDEHGDSLKKSTRSMIQYHSMNKSAQISDLLGRKLAETQGLHLKAKKEIFQFENKSATANNSNISTVNNTLTNPRVVVDNMGFFNDKKRPNQIPNKRKVEGTVEIRGRDLTLSDLCEKNVVSPSFKMMCEGQGPSSKEGISNFNSSVNERDQGHSKEVQSSLKLKIKEEMKKKILESHKNYRERVTERSHQEERRLVENTEYKFSASIKLAPNQEEKAEKLQDTITNSREYNSTIQSLKNSIEMLKNSRIYHNSDRIKRKTENSGSPNNTAGCIKNQSNKLRNAINGSTTFEDADSTSYMNPSLNLKRNSKEEAQCPQEINQAKDFLSMINREKKKSLDKRLFIDEPREKEKIGSAKTPVQTSVLQERSGKWNVNSVGKNCESICNQNLNLSAVTSKAAAKAELGGVKGILIESMLNDKTKCRNLPSFILNNRDKDKMNDSQKLIRSELNKLKSDSLKKRSVSVNRKAKRETYLDFSSSDDYDQNSDGVNYQSDVKSLLESRKESTLKKSSKEVPGVGEKKNHGGAWQKENSLCMNRASELKRNFELIYREYKFNKKIAGAGECLMFTQNV